MSISENFDFDYLKQVIRNPFTIIFIVVLLCKILLTFIGPFFSSDYARNLFYGKAFWEYGFSVYNMTPLQIDPNYSIGDPTSGMLAYQFTTYDYPVVQILFWAFVSLFPFVVGKIILSLVDAINFFLIRSLMKNTSKIERESLSWFYFIFVSIFSTIDGQAEVITLLLMLLTLKYVKRPNLAFFLVAIGLLWKYIPVILLLYLVLVYRNDIKVLINGFAIFIVTTVVLSIIPLMTSDYIFRYVGYFGNLPFHQIPSNPMSWRYLYISSILLWLLLFYLFYYLLKNKEQIPDFSILVPILLFLKYYQFAFPWYWVWIIPGILTLKEEETRKFILRFLLVLLPIAVIDFINLTVGFGYVLTLFGF